MREAKKIITRMCMNNWGGVEHKILTFHEYVNLFSGKSGSGKSTVMDAIQVILYGSFSPAFLNKAADDAKNRRSVISYLRGEQKDGTANREGKDFCSTIALEIEDTSNHIVTCVGVAFEVRISDSEVRKFVYFSHSGRMPEGGYRTEEGIPYDNKQIRHLVEERSKSEDNRGKGEVNRIYPSKEAYLGTLFDVILGYIDGNRFMTMEKSAIALKMTNGTGQFIRDYMFPRSEGKAIGKISEQLGKYRDIKEQVEDLEKRISYLTRVKEAHQEVVNVGADIVHGQAALKFVDILALESRIEADNQELSDTRKKCEEFSKKDSALKEQREDVKEALIKAESDLKATDYGSKKERLEELTKRADMLAKDSVQWRKTLSGLQRWVDEEIVTDYVSNPTIYKIEEFQKGAVSVSQCARLREALAGTREMIRDEIEELREQKQGVQKEYEAKKKRVEDMKHDRKSYGDMGESIRKARKMLRERLAASYGHAVEVQVLADLFDIREEEWKDAVEGRMGRLKLCLITEPKYAHDAAVIFRSMKEFEEIELINSRALMDSGPQALKGTLYEAVTTEIPYVDACLKRFLGHIVKCRSVEELEQVHDGVTPDCYSYSNFRFRHLKKRDYTWNACIGSKVSKAKLAEYEADTKKLSEALREVTRQMAALNASMEFEALGAGDEYLAALSRSQEELEEALAEKAELSEVIRKLKEGKYRELEGEVQKLKEQSAAVEAEIEKNSRLLREYQISEARLSTDINNKQEELNNQRMGYKPGEAVEEEVRRELSQVTGQTLKGRIRSRLERLGDRLAKADDNLARARNNYIFAYPSCNLSGTERTNDAYDKLLNDYLNNYRPEYQKEFEKQCDLIYKSLRDNVIAAIHGDIKAARRHAAEINRMLRETNFADSIYQIKIEPAKNENAQFYEMLMAEELDSKVLYDDEIEGQMSLGQDTFLQKYERQINLLTEKFMPARGEDEMNLAKRRQEMERYADYRNYLSFSMYERVEDEKGNIRENMVDEMAGRDSGGEGQNPKYVALMAGFAMLYMSHSNRDSRIKLVLLDEAFSKMDQERSEVCLKYARKLNLQLIVCVPDERLQSLIQNVDSVYGFRRYQNQISMMHIDKGRYLQMMEGEEDDEGSGENDAGPVADS
ncbi:SbcC/MukB-like Walker B domain-containing protein [Roseburia hominis]